jgi:hypothetical protein
LCSNQHLALARWIVLQLIYRPLRPLIQITCSLQLLSD